VLLLGHPISDLQALITGRRSITSITADELKLTNSIPTTGGNIDHILKRAK
jgi:hypothetical protein